MSPRIDPHASRLGSAQADYDAGRYQAALDVVRAADFAADPLGLRLRTLAAFRIGELAESADAALALIGSVQRGGDAEAIRFDTLAVSVVAAGELARYDQSIEHLQLLNATAARGGSLSEFVRARGTAATCFALMGDPWAAQRLMSELLGLFQANSGELRLEATTRGNHASVCLQIARLARQGGDVPVSDEALDHAEASLQRACEIGAALGDARVAAFADVHRAEVDLLRGRARAALERLDGAAARAEAAGLHAHVRSLRLLRAEAWIAEGDHAAAREKLDAVAERIHDGHELGSRIRLHTLQQQVLAAGGDAVQALTHSERARELGRWRQYRQARAQSQWLRVRLEVEHMYRFRPGAKRSSGASRPGALHPT